MPEAPRAAVGRMPGEVGRLRSTRARALALRLALAALAGCAKDKEPVQAEPPAASPVSSPSSIAAAAPPAVDASFLSATALDAGLTPREDDELATILSRLDAPCSSEAVSIAQCITDHRACSDCSRAARYLARGVHQGWPALYVQKAFRARFNREDSVDLPVGGSPTQGPSSAAVTIVEFGSYVCPHCALEAPKLDALQKAHPKDVRIVFKPIWSPQDEMQVRATRAALAAAAQGKFWEMHALLFANQPKFDIESIDGYAKSIGLDTKKLHAGIVSAAVTEQMNEDIAAATTARVDALPSIWINGHPFLSFEDLESRIAFELAEKEPGSKR
ncbi:MAG: DsbA family protein [Polyangiaceae bacterium]|jgi:protein-disulfide isomerase